MKVRTWSAITIAALLWAPACGGEEAPAPEPLSVAGTYSFYLTYGANGCGFGNWPRGESLLSVPVEISQIGTNALAVPAGAVGMFLDEQSGIREFSGPIGETGITLELQGQRSFLEGQCSYRYNGTLEAEVFGDFISGEIRYVGSTNNNPGCDAIEGCVSSQAFNATKPPGGGIVVVDPDGGIVPVDAGP